MNETNPHKVISRIETKYGFEDGDLSSKKVSKYLSKARREAILELKSMDLSWTHIGQLLNREHSSVMKLVVEKSGDKKGKKRG